MGLKIVKIEGVSEETAELHFVLSFANLGHTMVNTAKIIHIQGMELDRQMKIAFGEKRNSVLQNFVKKYSEEVRRALKDAYSRLIKELDGDVHPLEHDLLFVINLLATAAAQLEASGTSLVNEAYELAKSLGAIDVDDDKEGDDE